MTFFLLNKNTKNFLKHLHSYNFNNIIKKYRKKKLEKHCTITNRNIVVKIFLSLQNIVY